MNRQFLPTLHLDGREYIRRPEADACNSRKDALAVGEIAVRSLEERELIEPGRLSVVVLTRAVSDWRKDR